MKSLKVIATSFVAAAGLLLVGAPAANAQEYDVYWSRAEVVEKAGVLSAATFLCGFAPWYISQACQGGDAAVVFDYAALKGCKVKQHVVIGGQMSYDRATHTYYPYECNKPNA